MVHPLIFLEITMKTRYLTVALIALAGFNWLIGAAGIAAAVLVNFDDAPLGFIAVRSLALLALGMGSGLVGAFAVCYASECCNTRPGLQMALFIGATLIGAIASMFIFYSKPWIWLSFNYDLFWIMLFGLIGSGLLVGVIGSYLEYKFNHWLV